MPFLGQRFELPKPLPLGDRRLLAGWLPRQREAVQIVELDALLAAERLSDVLPGSGVRCPLMAEPRNLLATTATASIAESVFQGMA